MNGLKDLIAVNVAYSSRLRMAKIIAATVHISLLANILKKRGKIMTRGEEIKCASKDYINYLLDKQEYHNENYTEYDIQQAFEKGAQWAYNNPKSPWISVNEKLPPIEKDNLSIKVLVVSTKGKINFSRYDYDTEVWISPVLDIEFTHWMPIPELLK